VHALTSRGLRARLTARVTGKPRRGALLESQAAPPITAIAARTSATAQTRAPARLTVVPLALIALLLVVPSGAAAQPNPDPAPPEPAVAPDPAPGTAPAAPEGPVPVQPAPPSGGTSPSPAPAPTPAQPAPTPAQSPSSGAVGAEEASAAHRRSELRAAARRERARKLAAREAAAREAAAVSEKTAPPSTVVRIGSLLNQAQPGDDSHSELLVAGSVLLVLVMLSGSLLSVATRTTRGRPR
jgi:hypothetical protein